jgi:DNA invertase Pin-like site-specific DNA recombinase
MRTEGSTSSRPAPKAGLYLRISDDRLGDELGVRRQEKLCRDLAAARGFEVAAVYTDNDVSAFRGRRRPGYEQLLADVEAGAVAAVVAYHPDRLYRHPRDLERFVETVEAAGAAVATVTAGDVDLSTASGRMVARMLGAAARYESEHKAERHRAKHAELAAAGRGVGGGTRPFGFEADRVTIRESEAVLIREAAARILSGGSLRSLHRDWTARGIVSPAGGPWAKGSLRRLLLSARIAGLRSHRGVVVAKAGWPAIISREDHEALVAILTAPERDKRKESPRRKYLLTGGMARCGRCGAALVARPNERGHRRYVCSHDHSGCGRTFILAEPLEDFMAEALFEAIAGQAFDRARARAAARSTSLAAVELAEVEQRLDALASAYADGGLTLAAYRKATSKLEGRLVTLRTAAAAEATGATWRALPGGAKALRSWWDSATIDQRAGLVALVIEVVTIGAGTRGRNRFEPQRVQIRWRV